MTEVEVREGTGRMGARALVASLVLVVVVAAIVSSLGAPLVPRIAATYQVNVGTAQWSLTITLLAGAVATPLLGRLGDGPHRRRVMLTTLALVAAGCVLAALAAAFWMLLLGRALQGLGLGLMPLAMAVARDHLEESRVRRAVVLLSITTVAGAGIGYPISGALGASVGVDASYWFGAGVVTVVLVVALAVIPQGAHLPRRAADLPGGLLLGSALAAGLVAVSREQYWGWGSPAVLGLLVVAAVLMATWFVVELRVRAPLVDLRLLAHRGVLLADVTAVIAGVGIYMVMSSVSWLLQAPPTGAGGGMGHSALVASCAMVPFSVLSVSTSQLVPRLLGRHADAWLLATGFVFFALSAAGLGWFRGSTVAVFAIMGVCGMGAGCTFSAMPSIIVHAVPGHEVGSAMGFNQVLRTVGYSTGSAASATVLAGHVVPGTTITLASGYDAVAVLSLAVFALGAASSVALGPVRRSGDHVRGADEDLLATPEP